MKYNYTYFTLAEAPEMKEKGMLPTIQKQKKGYGYFYCTSILGDRQKFGGPERTVENVKFVTCVFADFDNPKEYENVDHFIETTLRDVEASIPIAPTRIVRTAKGLHYTWNFTEPLTPTHEIKELFYHIPEFIGCDPGCKDITRVLRVPGSMHWKTGKPIEVKLLKEEKDNVYTLDEIKKAFCFVPKEQIKKEQKEVNKNSVWFKYNNDSKYSFHGILIEGGWSIWDEKRKQYTRPGKKDGNSGNILEKDGNEFFYTWTSSDSRLRAKTVYSKSWLLCHLKFNGNNSDTQKYLESLYPEITEKQVDVSDFNQEIIIPEFCMRGSIGEMTNCFGELEFSNLTTSIIMAGAACGKVNYVEGMTFIKLSLYVLLVGAPASGKTSRVEIASEVLRAPIYDVHNGGTPESGQSLVRIACGLKKVEKDAEPIGDKKKKEIIMISTPNYQTLFTIDEFYSCVRSANSVSSTLLEKLRSGHMARSLTTSSLSNQNDLNCGFVLTAENPYIYVISGITSTELQDLIKSSPFEAGGLASRFLFSNTVHRKRSQEEEMFGDSKKMDRIGIHRLCEQIKNTQKYDNKILLPFKDIITREIMAHNDLMSARYGFTYNEEDDAVTNRVQQNVYAIAIIYMRAEGREVLNMDDIEAGWWICRRSIDIYNHYRTLSRQRIFEDKQDSNKVAIRNLLVEVIFFINGKCTLNEIRRNSKHKRRFDNITPEKVKNELELLVSSNDIRKEITKNTKNGQEVIFYYPN